jgi:undecaprenyl-diphosphatase
MLESALWGLIQGLTEFLPISSSGHLVLVPALFGREGPDLATSAVLHIGTLVAVLLYFRSEVAEVLRFTAAGKRLLSFMLIGTIPAAVAGLALRDPLDRLNENPTLVALAMIGAGVVFVSTRLLPSGTRGAGDTQIRDAIVMGVGQALALIPGVSRSGMTISAGMEERFERREAASLAFLLGIPAIAGAGLINFVDLAAEGGAGLGGELLVGMLVAGVVGYAAIAALLGLIRRTGLTPFGWYCIGFGVVVLLLV